MVALILHQWMKPLFLGLAFGLFVSYFSAEALAAHLYETAPTDGVIYLAVTAVITFVCITAACIPARRAARIDPVSVLKHE